MLMMDMDVNISFQLQDNVVFPVHERSYYNPAMNVIVIVIVAVADVADVVAVANDDFYLLLC